MPFTDGRVEADPYGNYAWLRDREPVCPLPVADGEPASWMLSRFSDVRAALMDPRLTSDRRHWGGYRPEAAGPATFTDHQNAIVGLDGPRHTHLRRLVTGAFQARRVEAVRARCAAVADALIDDFAARGGADLVAEYTLPLAGRVIGEVVGLPDAYVDRLADWSQLVVDAAAQAESVGQEEVAAVESFLVEAIEARRADPGEDLLSDLLAAADGEGALSQVELAAMAYVLLTAGHIPMLHYLGGILFRVLTQPEVRHAVTADGEAARALLDDLARIDSATQLLITRYAREELTIGGQHVAPGDSVVLCVAAANRDERQFAAPECPRADRRTEHLAFGHGPHFCVGAPLARIEAEVAVRALLRRLPDLTLTVAPTAVAWHGAPYRRGPRELPVRFTPAAAGAGTTSTDTTSISA